MGLGAQQQFVFFFQFRRAHLLQIFFQPLQSLFDLPKIADHQVEFHILDVARGINIIDVRDRWIHEPTHHVSQRVYLPQMADVGALLQSILSNRPQVDVFHGSMSQFLGIEERGQPVEPVIRHFCHANMRLARIGVGGRGETCFRQHTEQRRFADLGETNDAGFHKEAFSRQPSALKQ